VPVARAVLGRDTAAAVGNGSMLAIAAAIDRAVRIVREVAAADPALLLTGGDAERLVPWLESDAVVEPDLVLEAMRIVADSTE
jgi:type III pantothenate kinase